MEELKRTLETKAAGNPITMPNSKPRKSLLLKDLRLKTISFDNIIVYRLEGCFSILRVSHSHGNNFAFTCFVDSPKCRQGDIYPDPMNCSRFYQCVAGTMMVQNCPRDLYFNQHRLLCDVPGTYRTTSIHLVNKRPLPLVITGR